MKFEYDAAKSASNKAKHGIDFVEAQLLWEDGQLVIVPVRTVGEERSLAIGQLNRKVWTAVHTMRGENVRLISVRRARREEVELYEES